MFSHIALIRLSLCADAGTAPVQFFLGDLAVPMVPDKLVFIHGIWLFHDQSLAFVPKHPHCRHPDILMHGRGHGADHPAVALAAAHILPHPKCFGAMPQFLKTLGIQISHDFLFFRAVAGHHIPKGVDKKGIEAHVAFQQPLAAIDIVNEAMTEKLKASF